MKKQLQKQINENIILKNMIDDILLRGSHSKKQSTHFKHFSYLLFLQISSTRFDQLRQSLESFRLWKQKYANCKQMNALQKRIRNYKAYQRKKYQVNVLKRIEGNNLKDISIEAGVNVCTIKRWAEKYNFHIKTGKKSSKQPGKKSRKQQN